MWTLVKAFFGSNAGKSVLIIFAVCAAMASVYVMGSSRGYTKGYSEGQADGRQSRQEEIDHLKDNVAALTTTINDEREATNEKIKAVEAEAADRALKTKDRLYDQIQARDQIIRNYERTVPAEVQQSCGLSIETVMALNQLIDKVNGETHENLTSSTPAVADSVSVSPSSQAIRGRSVDPEDGDSQHSASDASSMPKAPAP